MILRWAKSCFVVLVLTLGDGSSGKALAYDTAVDLELVLAIDVSFSIGIDEQDVQRLAYITAFRSPRIAAAMTSGANGQIAVTYVEWGDSGFQRVVIPWRLISSRADAAMFAEDLEKAPIRRSGATSISAALEFSAALFRNNGFHANRQLIDISGDGLNSEGPPVDATRAKLNTLGITVNALPLASKDSDLTPKDLTAYYDACVATGPGSFTLPAASTQDFAIAMQRKMIAEIASGIPEAVPRGPEAKIWNASLATVDCLMGERQRREDYLDMLRDLTNGRPERWQPDRKTWPVP
ncbi:MAG: DUF1194 domain-containing protein [Pseudomonadota bacterium]